MVLENISVKFTKLTEIAPLLFQIASIGKRKNCFTIVCFVDYTNGQASKFPWLRSDGIAYASMWWFYRLFKTLDEFIKVRASADLPRIGDLGEVILSVIQIDQYTVKPARLNRAFEIKGKCTKSSWDMYVGSMRIDLQTHWRIRRKKNKGTINFFFSLKTPSLLCTYEK